MITVDEASKIIQSNQFDFGSEEIELIDSLNRILAENSGQEVKRIEKDTDRDFIMSAKEAAEYGIIDEVISKR